MLHSERAVAQMRQRYLAEAVETASPATRLTMLFDRLDLDLRNADTGFADKDIKKVSDSLIHAQEIIMVLMDTMRRDVWDGAPRLLGLYAYLRSELVAANMDKNRERAAAAAVLISQIGGAWRRAAASVQQQLEPVGGVG